MIKHDQPNLYRLYRDVGDDSPWYDRALWQAVVTLDEIASGEAVAKDAAARLDDIERTLRERS